MEDFPKQHVVTGVVEVFVGEDTQLRLPALNLIFCKFDRVSLICQALSLVELDKK